MKQVIETKNAPSAIGSYSQSIIAGDFLFISGQIPINPNSGEIDTLDFRLQTNQVFENLLAIIKAANAHDENIVKINAYLTDLVNFPIFNEVMSHYIKKPFPARAAVGVASLPKGALVEAEAIVYIPHVKFSNTQDIGENSCGI